MKTRTLAMAAVLTLGTACHPAPPPAPHPEAAPPAAATPPAPSRVGLRGGWNGHVLYRRADSIILALPGGEKQVQQLGRAAGFSLRIGEPVAVTIRLDTLAFLPATAGSTEAVGTTWTGRLTGSRLGPLSTTGSGPLIGDLSQTVENLFPRLPTEGVTVGMRWRDSNTVERQLGVFRVLEDRRGEWEAGQVTDRGGVKVVPITVHETQELRGQGNQAGRVMNMTAQGVRSTTYYVTLSGRLDGLVQRDSAAILVSIPDTRQVVPTVRIGRVTVVVR